MGKRTLRVPRDRKGEFATALFKRSRRSEKALVEALASDVRLQGSAFDREEALNRRRGRCRTSQNVRLEQSATDAIGFL